MAQAQSSQPGIKASARERPPRPPESLVEEIVRRITQVYSPDRIILFGSAATGEMTRDSDVDLLLLTPGEPDWSADYVRVRAALGDMGYPFDILFITTEWFEESKDVIGGIAYPANKYGRVIYEAA